jgi:hypothetical protein
VPRTGRPQWAHLELAVRTGGGLGPRRNLTIVLPSIEMPTISKRKTKAILSMLQPVLRPECAFFDGGKRVFGQVQAKAGEQAAFLAMGDEADLVAVEFFHLGRQMADAVDEAKVNRLGTHPDIGVEEVGVGQAGAAPGPDVVDEGRVDRGLDGFQAVDVFGLLRQEGVGKAFGAAGGDDAAFDALAGHEFGEAEGGEDDADGANQRRRVDPDLVARTGKPVATRSRHIFDKGVDGHILFI